MNYITQSTENRIKKMVKLNHKYGLLLLDMLNDLKSSKGSYGFEIKALKNKCNILLDNEFQINVCYYNENLCRALSYKFEDLISSTFCLNLHYVTVKNFNKLVKLIYELPNNGYCYF